MPKIEKIRINAKQAGISYTLSKSKNDEIFQLRMRFDREALPFLRLGEISYLVGQLEKSEKYGIDIKAASKYGTGANEITLTYSTWQHPEVKLTREGRSAAAVHSLLCLIEDLELTREIALPKIATFKEGLTELIETYQSKDNKLEIAMLKARIADEKAGKPAVNALITQELAEAYRNQDLTKKGEQLLYEQEFKFSKPGDHWPSTMRTRSWANFQKVVDNLLGEVEEKALTPEEKSIQAQGPYIEEFIDSLNEQASILGEIEQEENYDAPESVINRLNKKLKEERAKLDPKTIKRKD